jgi:hypothetical protein
MAKPIRVELTLEMRPIARLETHRRLQEGTVRRKFLSRTNYTQEQNDMIGFCGEIAARSMLGLDFNAVRSSYSVPDKFDIDCNGWKIDVKTESIPVGGANFFRTVVEGRTSPGTPYHARWYNIQQVDLLRDKDVVLFGAVARHEPFRDPDAWWFLGWATPADVASAPIVEQRALSAFAVPTEVLRGLDELREIVGHQKP